MVGTLNLQEQAEQVALAALTAKMRQLHKEGLTYNEICPRLVPLVLSALHIGCRMKTVEDALVDTMLSLEEA